MKYAEINKRYTEVVAEYIGKGYIINSSTMSGSQGEISKVDMTDGKKVIRVLMEDFREYNDCHDLEGIRIIVGLAGDDTTPNSGRQLDTIWNNRLEVVSCEKFYEIGAHGRRNKFYGTRDEAIASETLRHGRWKSRQNDQSYQMPDAARDIALRYVRRQPRCKSAKLSDIEDVSIRFTTRPLSGEVKKEYIIKAKGVSYRLR